MNCLSKRRSAAPPGRSKGFTLIELVLALGLTALLLVMLSGGVYSVVRDWDSDAAGLDASLDETVTLLQIERALQGAFPHSYRGAQTLTQHVFFVGQSDRLDWVSTVSPQRGSGLLAWRLYSERGEGLYLQLVPALTDEPSDRLDDAEPILLLDNYEARFRYLFEDFDASRAWEDEWDGAERQSLPLAVHVQLLPIDASARQTLDIVAPIQANQHRSIPAANRFQGGGSPMLQQGEPQ